MTGMLTTTNVREALLSKTEAGPVTGWVDRMGEVARAAGVPVRYIDWTGSPDNVAFRVVKEAAAQQGGMLAALAALL